MSPENTKRVSPKTVERLSLYRRTLDKLPADSNMIYSHELARMSGGEASQVRRDLMAIGALVKSGRGYDVESLKRCIDVFFDVLTGHSVAVVGVGTLGRSLIEYFNKWYYRLKVAALFDRDPEKVGRIFQGVRCYSIERIPEVIREMGISIAVLAIPDTGAQEVADALVGAGVKGILNFSPVSLRVPLDTRVENINITIALDKLAFFACQGRDADRRGRE